MLVLKNPRSLPTTGSAEGVRVAARVSRWGIDVEPISVTLLVGGAHTVLPEELWRRLGLTADWDVDLRRTEGTVVTRGVSECRIEVDGHSVTTPVVLGAADEGPLLGSITIDALGFATLAPAATDLPPSISDA